MNQLIAVAVAVAVMAVAYKSVQQSGVRQERVRVEAQGKKTHAKADAARKVVEKKPPHEITGDLARYCRDCK